MAQTTSAQMIDPEVWGDMMQAEFVGRTVLGQENGFATVDDTLEGEPGSTVQFPKWMSLGDELDDLDESTAMTPALLDTDPGDTHTVKEAGKAAEVTDRALLVSYGDPLAEVRRQFGRMTVRKIDGDLRAAAETTAKALTTGANFGAFTVADALGLFGDEADPADFAGFVIHSKQRTDLFKDDNFISADKYGQSVLVRGEVGRIYNIPIVVSDRVTVTDGGTAADTYTTLLVKRGALGLLYKRRPVVEQDRDILARSTVVTTNIHYAAALLNANGVAKVVTQ